MPGQQAFAGRGQKCVMLMGPLTTPDRDFVGIKSSALNIAKTNRLRTGDVLNNKRRDT